jgi:hypothetical protein
MRKFSVTLDLPAQCECCGTQLPAADHEQTRGIYRVELPEGEIPTRVAVGNAVRVTLARGVLLIELRQSDSSKGTWALEPMYNTEAFGKVRRDLHDEHGDGKADSWIRFSSTLPQFKPWYSTWHAELKFVEALPLTVFGRRPLVSAPNAATLRVKLETLD